MQSAVLFIIFKRPDTTRRVFERIREAQPPRLYIAADGPRKNRPDEAERCLTARKVVENIDWPCEVHRLYRDDNMGCGKGVSSAITWFFEHEEQGIIIEDDILPHIDFFRYCDEMLERYKDNDRIQMIAGTNYFYDGYQADHTYYMSSCAPIWGWATWRRVWTTYQFDLHNYSSKKIKSQLYNRLSKDSALFFFNIYRKMLGYEIDTWDYQFVINQLYYDRYAIVPFVNMTKNIGLGDSDATHTKNYTIDLSNHDVSTPYPINHPDCFYTNIEADEISKRNSKQFERNRLYKLVYRIFRLLRCSF